MAVIDHLNSRPETASAGGPVSHLVAGALRPGLADGLARLALSAYDTVQAWNDARVTRKALSRLSTHELNDIGLTPNDVVTWTGR